MKMMMKMLSYVMKMWYKIGFYEGPFAQTLSGISYLEFIHIQSAVLIIYESL